MTMSTVFVFFLIIPNILTSQWIRICKRIARDQGETELKSKTSQYRCLGSHDSQWELKRNLLALKQKSGELSSFLSSSTSLCWELRQHKCKLLMPTEYPSTDWHETSFQIWVPSEFFHEKNLILDARYYSI